MAEEYLLRFLTIGVINQVDDQKLAKLQETVKTLAAALKQAPAKTASFTMVAADPEVSPTDPTIEEAMVALRKTWVTVVNTFATTPVAVVRAMLLDALVQAARADDAIAVAFVNSARNALPYVESKDEGPIWHDAVSEIETKVDERAVAEWTTPDAIEISPMAYVPAKPVVAEAVKAEISGEQFKAKVTAAVSQNQHNIHNNVALWAQNFGVRMAEAIVEEFNPLLAQLSPKPVDLSAPLQGVAKAVSDHVDQALKAFSAATTGLQRRTNLLWWKEALYSPSVHTSYRDLPPYHAAALMALDLHEQVPLYSPASVSALLRETIESLSAPAADALNEAGAIVRDARVADATQPLRALAAQLVAAAGGRGPILALLGHPATPTSLDNAAVRTLSGISALEKLTPSAWGALLFRELQAARATNSTGSKRARRK